MCIRDRCAAAPARSFVGGKTPCIHQQMQGVVLCQAQQPIPRQQHLSLIHICREDLALAQRCAGRPAIALVNKEDKPTRFDAELIAPYFAMVLPVCCREEGSRKEMCIRDSSRPAAATPGWA